MTVHVLRQSVQLTVVVVEPWEYTAGCRGCGHLRSLCTLVGAGSGTWRSARRRLGSSRNSSHYRSCPTPCSGSRRVASCRRCCVACCCRGVAWCRT